MQAYLASFAVYGYPDGGSLETPLFKPYDEGDILEFSGKVGVTLKPGVIGLVPIRKDVNITETTDTWVSEDRCNFLGRCALLAVRPYDQRRVVRACDAAVLATTW